MGETVRKSDRPILFSAPLVLALLREAQQPGTGKTQTRRTLKPRRGTTLADATVDAGPALGGIARRMEVPVEQLAVPYQVGDRLWVREAWRANYGLDYHDEGLGRPPRPSEFNPVTTAVEYLADGERDLGGKNRSPLFLPRWASRLTLLVTEVRVERLNDISEADAVAEGVHPICDHGVGNQHLHSIAFQHLWCSLHGDGAWIANPWIVAVTFRPILANIDALPDAIPEASHA